MIACDSSDLSDIVAMVSSVRQMSGVGVIRARATRACSSTIDAGQIVDVLHRRRSARGICTGTLLDVPLELRVLYFSSVGSGLSNVGQGNYAAGNACLDSMALCGALRARRLQPAVAARRRSRHGRWDGFQLPCMLQQPVLRQSSEHLLSAWTCILDFSYTCQKFQQASRALCRHCCRQQRMKLCGRSKEVSRKLAHRCSQAGLHSVSGWELSQEKASNRMWSCW